MAVPAAARIELTIHLALREREAITDGDEPPRRERAADLLVAAAVLVILLCLAAVATMH